MSNKVGDISIDESSYLNDSFEDLYDSDYVEDSQHIEETSSSYEEDVSSKNNNNSEEYQEDDSYDESYDESYDDDEYETYDESENGEYTNEEIDLDSYNTLAILALTLKDQEPDLIDFDIEEDIKPEDFVSKLRDRFSSIKENIEKSIVDQYGHASEYLKMIINGADNSDIQQALSLNQIASLDVDEIYDDEILENVIKTWFKVKQIPDGDDLLEVYKDRGVLYDKAKEAVSFFKEQEELYLQNWEFQRKKALRDQEVGYQQYQNAVKTIIDKGSVKGLPIRDKKRFEDSLFKSTELVEITDENGNTRTQRVPLLQLKMNNFRQDLEQQLALQLLILDDFDFTSIVDKAKRTVNNNLLNTLNKRVSNSSRSRKNSIYFED